MVICIHKERIAKVILWLLVLAWMVVIFCFSAQPADVSDKTSRGVTKKIVKTTIEITHMDKKKDLDVDALVKQVDGFVRKLAHAYVFCVLGILVFLLAKTYRASAFKAFAITIFACFLYACSDEIHQLFVHGRACRFSDVLIDSTGALLGIGIASVCCYAVKKIKLRLKK